MKLNALTTLPHLEEFLAGTQPVTFSVRSTKADCYQWIQASLVKFEYLTLSKPHKGLVRRYLEQMSGYSRQQLTRLIQLSRQTGRVRRRQRTVHGFARRYTEEDRVGSGLRKCRNVFAQLRHRPLPLSLGGIDLSNMPTQRGRIRLPAPAYHHMIDTTPPATCSLGSLAMVPD